MFVRGFASFLTVRDPLFAFSILRTKQKQVRNQMSHLSTDEVNKIERTLHTLDRLRHNVGDKKRQIVAGVWSNLIHCTVYIFKSQHFNSHVHLFINHKS